MRHNQGILCDGSSQLLDDEERAVLAAEMDQVEVIEPGGLFGELSLLDNRDRSASAKALEETELLIVDRDDLRMLIKSHPDAAIDIMAILGARLRESNFLIRDRVTRNVNEEIPQAASLGQRLSGFSSGLCSTFI